jgi:signal transduction histidine kinase
MIRMLGSLEAVRAAIEPDWRQHFASRLSGPNGLELAVEVAHDLRSPLTSILFLAETLQSGHSGPVTDLQSRQLGLVYSAALGLSELASNVIELARGGGRLAEDQPLPFSVGELLHSVRDMVRPMAEEKGLEVRLLPPASDHRLGHSDALSRVLLNLTTNALKFTEEGFVEIVAREKNLTQLEFSVRDTGKGIAPHALDTLYLPFRRSVAGDGYHFSGTGLGLALSRRLVEVMGSELHVESRPAWGTRFYFDLQLHPVHHI